MKMISDFSEAFDLLKSNSTIFIHGGAATPLSLLEGLRSLPKSIHNVELIHLHTEGEAFYAKKNYGSQFKVSSLFVGSNLRADLRESEVDYLPCFLSEIPLLFKTKKKKIDVALIHVSPPDRHGYCSLGVSVDIAKAALDSAKWVVAQINPQMPRVHGDGLVHVDRIHYAMEVNDELPSQAARTLSKEEIAIGVHIASLVDDGSTLQVGIGAIPDAALHSLSQHKNLGLHTEMWSDRALDLILSGAINNIEKNVHRGKSVSTFLIGSRRLYDFVNDNPGVIQLEADYVNSPEVISRNPKVVAINSAVEVDLTGQICADSVGRKIISGVGGQMDFMRGAALSQNGKPIIAMTSRTKKGKSRIVETLAEGAGVVTTRAHVHYVVTEYGIVDLFGKTLSQRAKALIEIAHPEDRELLSIQWKKNRF